MPRRERAEGLDPTTRAIVAAIDRASLGRQTPTGTGTAQGSYGWSARRVIGATPTTGTPEDRIAQLEGRLAEQRASLTEIAFTAHDVAAVAVRLRPDPEADSSGNVWDQLSEKWHGALDPDSLDDVFGTAEVFTGVADEPAADLLVAASDAAHKVLAAHGDSGLELSTVVEPGVALWTMELRWGRRVVALGDTAAASTVEAWCT